MKAIITTAKDLSANIFANHGWDVILYSDQTSEPKHYDTIYFRDPFNDESVRPFAEEYVNNAFASFSWDKSIDGIQSFAQMRDLEDKYLQYQTYQDLMPRTYLPSECDFEKGKHLAKKRLSQRSKDIKFELESALNDDWIIQDLMDIREELRVYAIFGKVIPQATIKSSKHIDTKVKVVGERELNTDEIELCTKIAQLSQLDFIGLDLAILENGNRKLIEVNRSPQFKRFVDIYGDTPLTDILDFQ